MSKVICDEPSQAQEPQAFGPFCPSCKADLDGGPIPEDIRQHYSPPYRWERRIGISDGDSVYAWHCPDCEHQWLREGYDTRAFRAGWKPA